MFINQWAVKGEVDFQNREVLKVLSDTVHRQYFFCEGLFPHHLGALPDATTIAIL